MKAPAPKSMERQNAVRSSFGLPAKEDPTAVPAVEDHSEPDGDEMGAPDQGGAQAILNDPNAMQAIDQLSQMGFTSDDVKAAMDQVQGQGMGDGQTGEIDAL